MKIIYKPEIEGLRAIAVVSVIIYHAKISFFSYNIFEGGYLGVDIFFVISGYLISMIILKDIDKKKFLINFFERRIRRIVPVFLTVLVISLPVAWLSLMPNNMIDFTKSIIASIFFFSNLYFESSLSQYSQIDSLFIPLLHTWSLSIEVQFYIIFSIVLMFVIKFLKKKTIQVFVLIFLLSLMWSEYRSQVFPDSNFYLLGSRVWEFLAGFFLAFAELRYKVKNNFLPISKLFLKVGNDILSIFGLALIIVSIINFNNQTPHPSFLTFFLIIGTCLIIKFGNEKTIVGKILKLKILKATGQISYSLYLWHYPIFAFYRIYFNGSTATSSFLIDKILIGFLVISLSILTYKLIEKPFRNKVNSFKKIIIFNIFLLFVIIIFSTMSFQSNGYEKRISSEIKNKVLTINFHSDEYRNCFIKFNYKKNEFCNFGNFDKQVILIGDSRAAFLINDLKEKINKKQYNLKIMVGSKLNFLNINDFEKFRLNAIKKIKNSTIIINGVYNDKESNYILLEQEKEFLDLFTILEENNNKVIFIAPQPIIKTTYDLSYGNMRIAKLIKDNQLLESKIQKKEYVNSIKVFNNFIKKMKEKLKYIHVLNLTDIFCDNNFCYSNRNQNILLHDMLHPSKKTVEDINNLILSFIEKYN